MPSSTEPLSCSPVLIGGAPLVSGRSGLGCCTMFFGLLMGREQVRLNQAWHLPAHPGKVAS
eukprot:9199127-Alexandrium_andersonii.AAC.1